MMRSTACFHMKALFAIRGPRGKWFRFIGATDALPIRPLWEECFVYEDWQGKPRPETERLCRKLGVDILFLIHIKKTPRGRLFREEIGAV